MRKLLSAVVDRSPEPIHKLFFIFDDVKEPIDKNEQQKRNDLLYTGPLQIFHLY